MPNARCENCNLYLDDICTKQKHVEKLIYLLKKRVKKFAGIPYNITPGIRHNEIISASSWNCLHSMCDGVLYYEQFAENPRNFDFNLDMLE
tara:strand:+ start:35 stop:307 length:273 start_codon:yes stop_codon:yes gene_type:complete